jgi:hypothetical protein
MNKPILCLEFDGVIHSGTSKWINARTILDAPVKESISFLVRALEDFEVHIYSTRSRYFGGRKAMKQWLSIHFCDLVLKEDPFFLSYLENFIFMDLPGLDLSYVAKYFVKQLKFPLFKPNAGIHLDAKAVCFTGKFPNLKTLKEFEPWYKKRKIKLL